MSNKPHQFRTDAPACQRSGLDNISWKEGVAELQAQILKGVPIPQQTIKRYFSKRDRLPHEETRK